MLRGRYRHEVKGRSDCHQGFTGPSEGNVESENYGYQENIVNEEQEIEAQRPRSRLL